MRRIFAMTLLAGMLGLSACTDRAEKLYQTATFEEQQYNRGHAAELYLEIISKYPDSPYAERARQRLDEMKMP